MTSLAYWQVMLNDPESLMQITAEARSANPQFPKGSNPFILARSLFLAGLGVPYSPSPEQFMGQLIAAGWRLLPAETAPRRGDVYACITSQKMVAHLGAVVWSRPNADYIMAVDEFSAEHEFRPYRRPISGNETDYLAVGYWLRLPCKSCQKSSS